MNILLYLLLQKIFYVSATALTKFPSFNDRSNNSGLLPNIQKQLEGEFEGDAHYNRPCAIGIIHRSDDAAYTTPQGWDGAISTYITGIGSTTIHTANLSAFG